MTLESHEHILSRQADELEAKIASVLAEDRPVPIAIAKLAECASRMRIKAAELAEKRAKAEP
ncbi:MAG: hypothetical protein AB7O24_28615 [Kofleriaceae bacterium]